MATTANGQPRKNQQRTIETPSKDVQDTFKKYRTTRILFPCHHPRAPFRLPSTHHEARVLAKKKSAQKVISPLSPTELHPWAETSCKKCNLTSAEKQKDSRQRTPRGEGESAHKRQNTLSEKQKQKKDKKATSIARLVSFDSITSAHFQNHGCAQSNTWKVCSDHYIRKKKNSLCII